MPDKKCPDCEGKTKDLEEVRTDHFDYKEKQIAFNNKLKGGLAVFSCVVGIFSAIGFFSYKGISSEVQAGQEEDKKLSVAIARVEEQMKSLNGKVIDIEKGQDKVLDKLQKILDEM